jgi:hypothetical protein
MTFENMDELLAASRHGPVSISQAEYELIEQKQHGHRLMDAARLFGDGERDWTTLRAPMGSHELPSLLSLVWEGLPHDQLITAVGDAWVMCDAPEKGMPRRAWLPMFRQAGYHDDDQPVTPPDRITLWRGGVRRTGMAWTADRDRAEWFQRRYDQLSPGHLWTIEADSSRLLAHYHQKHRSEDEYVVDTRGLRPKEIR